VAEAETGGLDGAARGLFGKSFIRYIYGVDIFTQQSQYNELGSVPRIYVFRRYTKIVAGNLQYSTCTAQ